MALANTSLDDKYLRESGPIYLAGSPALLRLAMNQLRRDKAKGLNTAAYVTG